MKPTSTNRLLIACLLAGSAACKTQPPASAPAQAVPAPTTATLKSTVATPAALPAPKPALPEPTPSVGMQDPFKLLNTAAAKTLDDGWKAVKKKQYAEARAAFHAVVSAYPDKTAARFAELKMAVKEGDFSAVPALWRQLLARDFVSYSKRLDPGGDKELAPLRKSPQWPAVQAITKEMKAAYAAGLDKGFFYVARIHPYAGPRFNDGDSEDDSETKLTADQEVYHFDPVTRLSRRLSHSGNSGATVLAIHPDGDKRHLMMVLAGALKKREGKAVFAQPQAVLLSLDTLESVGPLPISGDPAKVALCFSSKGEPIWAPTRLGTGEDPALTLDATARNLVSADEACDKSVAMTEVSPAGVEHSVAQADVALSEDGMQLTGVDDDVPVRSAQAIRPGSFSWSPGKKRFVYTGSVARCDAAAQPNALLVWDPARKRSARVSAAVSSYEAQWIDDDLLAYQSGLERVTKLTIHDFSPGGIPVTVNTPAGAGLFGIPVLGCAEAELHAFLR